MKQFDVNRIFSGDIFIQKHNLLLESMCGDVEEILRCAFSRSANLELVHLDYINSEFLKSLTQARDILFDSLYFRRKFINFIETIGLNPESFSFDIPRLRGVTPEAHLIAAAKSAFSAHRDTWYANPPGQINWWFPVFDVSESQVFAFYPDYFARQITNDSHLFDYQQFKEGGGFQAGKHSGVQVYPAALESLSEARTELFPLKRGEAIAFSACHLHQTRPNLSEKTRFSIDIRIVSLSDSDSARPADIDNHSKGDAGADYKRADEYIN